MNKMKTITECHKCIYGAEGGGGNFGMRSVVCCYYGADECDPYGDCANYEEKEEAEEQDASQQAEAGK